MQPLNYNDILLARKILTVAYLKMEQRDIKIIDIKIIS